jgi:hypothetical protein
MIGVISFKENIVNKLSESLPVINVYDIMDKGFPKLDGLFIDWVDQSILPDEYAMQAAVIEKYIRTKIPFVVFDGELAITKREYDWLKRFKVFFFEPALQNRREFGYLPHWLDEIKIDLNREEERPFALAYSTINLEDKLKSFEKYYRKYAQLFPDKKVLYQAEKLDDVKYKQYERDNMVNQAIIDWEEVDFTILIDSKKNYEIGYLNPWTFYIMENGCVPLLPLEHRFFGNMFHKLTVDNIQDVDWIVGNHAKIKWCLIDDIYNNIKTLYPEFLIENVAEVIKNCIVR